MKELFKKLQELYESDYISFTLKQKEEAGQDVSKWFRAAGIKAEGEGIVFNYIPETPIWLIPFFESYKCILRN